MRAPGPQPRSSTFFGSKDLLDEGWVLRLDLASRLQVVVVAGVAPVAGEVLRVVVTGTNGMLVEDPLLELGNVHRVLCFPDKNSLRIRLDESSTVSR